MANLPGLYGEPLKPPYMGLPKFPVPWDAIQMGDVKNPTIQSPAAPAKAPEKKVEPPAISSTQGDKMVSDLKEKVENLEQKKVMVDGMEMTPYLAEQYIKAKNQGRPGYDITGEKVDVNDQVQQSREQFGTYIGMDGQNYYKFDSTPVSKTTQTQGLQQDTRTDEQVAQDEWKLAKSTYDMVAATTDPYTRTMIENIQKQYGTLAEMQKMTNAGREAGVRSALIRGGSSRYSLSGEGINEATASFGALALQDLQQKELSAIADVKRAAEDKNWEKVGVVLKRVDEVRKEKQALAKAQSEKAAEELRGATIGDAISRVLDDSTGDFSDIYTRVRNLGVIVSPEELMKQLKTFAPIDSAKKSEMIRQARALGAKDDVISAMQSATNEGDLIIAAGPYLASNNDYAKYVADIAAHNERTGENLAIPDPITWSVMKNAKTYTSAAKTYSDKEIQEGYQVLETGIAPDGTVLGEPRGADKFVDSTVYFGLYDAWGGLSEDFLKNYPLTLLNPKETGIESELDARGLSGEWEKRIGKAEGKSADDYEFTAQEKRKLEQAGLSNAPRQEQLDFLYQSKGTDDLSDQIFRFYTPEQQGELRSAGLEKADSAKQIEHLKSKGMWKK